MRPPCGQWPLPLPNSFVKSSRSVLAARYLKPIPVMQKRRRPKRTTATHRDTTFIHPHLAAWTLSGTDRRMSPSIPYRCNGRPRRSLCALRALPPKKHSTMLSISVPAARFARFHQSTVGAQLQDHVPRRLSCPLPPCRTLCAAMASGTLLFDAFAYEVIHILTWTFPAVNRLFAPCSQAPCLSGGKPSIRPAAARSGKDRNRCSAYSNPDRTIPACRSRAAQRCAPVR